MRWAEKAVITAGSITAGRRLFYNFCCDRRINLELAVRKTTNALRRACGALIAVIGRHWLTSSDEEGRRRLDNPGDFVRLEIATALKRGIRVIPVLVDGASMPPSGQLPEDLKPLALRNALNVSHERFRADAERLIGGVGRALESAQVEQQRKREEQERLEAEQRERERPDAERRQHEEKLEDVPQSQLPSPVAPSTPPAQTEADKPSAQDPEGGPSGAAKAGNRFFSDRGGPGPRWTHLPRD